MNLNKILILALTALVVFITACDNSNDQMTTKELIQHVNIAIKNGNKDKAVKLLEEERKRLESKKHPVARESGLIHYKLGKLTGNKDFYKKSIPFFVKYIKSEERSSKPDFHEISSTCYILGFIYYFLEQNSRAIAYFEKSKNIQIANKYKDAVSINNYFYLSMSYFSEGDLDKAEVYGLKSIELSTEITGYDSWMTAACKANLAIILYDMKKKSKAISMLKNALKIYKKTKGKEKRIRLLTELLKKWTEV